MAVVTSISSMIQYYRILRHCMVKIIDVEVMISGVGFMQRSGADEVRLY